MGWGGEKIKLLPQLWVKILAFYSGNPAWSSPLWFGCGCFLNLVLQAKLPDGSHPVCLPGCSQVRLMNELLPCTSDPCITAFLTGRLWPQGLEVHDPPREQTTGHWEVPLSGALDMVLVFWALTWINCDHFEVRSCSSAVCSCNFFFFPLFYFPLFPSLFWNV